MVMPFCHLIGNPVAQGPECRNVVLHPGADEFAAAAGNEQLTLLRRVSVLFCDGFKIEPGTADTAGRIF